jgi:hypothetical protein
LGQKEKPHRKIHRPVGISPFNVTPFFFMSVWVNGIALSLPGITISGCDARYNRHFTFQVLYYDQQDYLIINKPYVFPFSS